MTSSVLEGSFARSQALPGEQPAFVSGVQGIVQMEVPISVEEKHADGLDAEPRFLQSATVEHVTWHVLSTQAVAGEAHSLTVVHALPIAPVEEDPASDPSVTTVVTPLHT